MLYFQRNLKQYFLPRLGAAYLTNFKMTIYIIILIFSRTLKLMEHPVDLGGHHLLVFFRFTGNQFGPKSQKQ